MKHHEMFDRQDSILAHPRVSFRYVVCVVSTVCLMLIYSNLHIFNFTSLCMQEEMRLRNNASDSNSTEPVNNIFEYSKMEKDLLFAAGYLGPLPAMLPMYHLMSRAGVSFSMFFCGLLTLFSTVLSPWAADNGFWYLMTMRLIQGIPVALCAPAISVICSYWSTLDGNGVYVSILAAHYQLAPLLTMPLAAVLCESAGWRWVYYVQGIITAIMFSLFALFYTDSPAENRFVSRYELRQIEKDKSHEEKHVEKAHTPMGAICRTPSIWGVWLTSVGGTIGFAIFLQYGPTYLNKVLHFNLSTTGWFAAIPYIFSCVARIVAQPLSANCEFLGERLAAVTSTTISMGTMALSFLVLIFIPQSWSSVAQVCYSLVIVANGLNGVGVTRCAQLVAKQHLRFVYSVRGFANCMVGLLLPILVYVVAPDDTHQQWTYLFIIIFVIVLSSTIFFAIVADAEAAPWTRGTVELDERSVEEDDEEQKQRY